MALLPIPSSTITFIDPITGGVDVQWQNFLQSISTISGNFAPLDARYWVSTSNVDLTNEQNLGGLTTGYLKLTVAAGVGTPSTTTTIPGTDISGNALTTANDTNVTLTAGGTPATALLRAASLTLGWTGQLGLARGGTNADLSGTGGTNQLLKQSSAGAAITVGTIATTNLSDVSAQQTFTPVLAFGGASTGITYTTQLGRYLQMGKYVFFQITLQLSNKGSSTGNAAVTGLPATSKNVTNDYVTVPLVGGGFSAISFTPIGYIAPNTTSLIPTRGVVAGTLTVLTDAEFTNVTNLLATGFYETE